jgi:hypothetical protein
VVLAVSRLQVAEVQRCVLNGDGEVIDVLVGKIIDIPNNAVIGIITARSSISPVVRPWTSSMVGSSASSISMTSPSPTGATMATTLTSTSLKTMSRLMRAVSPTRTMMPGSGTNQA